MRQLGGVGVWSAALRFGHPHEAAEAASEIEVLGYTALWFADAGGDVFGAVENLLRATQSIVVCTGILNLSMHSSVDVLHPRMAVPTPPLSRRRFDHLHRIRRRSAGIGELGWDTCIKARLAQRRCAVPRSDPPLAMALSCAAGDRPARRD